MRGGNADIHLVGDGVHGRHGIAARR
jgi:hypothetical protein